MQDLIHIAPVAQQHIASLVIILSSCILSMWYFALALITFATLSCQAERGELIERLENAEQITSMILKDIHLTWDIDHYPLFLKSAWMPRHSWDHLVARFEQRILQAVESGKSKNFTISFTGSSVTAGHDSPFKASFPVIAGEVMAPAFAPLDINLVSNNVAMGNNPCMPYDACVATYAGLDADIVHWEQQFNCFTDYQPRGIEQFIRQSMLMPLMPIVVLSGSVTPLWKEEECADVKAHHIGLDEKVLLEEASSGILGLRKIFTELNKDSRGKWGGDLHKLVHAYPQSCIQVFDHTAFEVYKCRGPYTKSWANGLGGWHPSLLGHKLRAHHHAFVWLSAWKLAVTQVLQAFKDGKSVNDMLSTITNLLGTLKIPDTLPDTVIPRSNEVSDNLQCYTEYEPHLNREKTLHNLVLSGFMPGNKNLTGGWASEILERLVQPKLIDEAVRQGYLDMKNIIYGNRKSGPLHFHIKVIGNGFIFLCEAPGVWGTLPESFEHLWESEMELYLTPLINGLTAENFVFTRSPKFSIPYRYFLIDEVCVRVPAKFPAGEYVLSVVPTKEDKKIMISSLLVP